MAEASNRGPRDSAAGPGPGATGPGRRRASLTPARRLAQQILVRVAEDGARATPLLDAAARRAALPAPDVAWLTELVYGTLRHGSALEGRLQRHLRAPFARLPVDVQCALRAGAYQLLHMRAPAYAAVDAAVQLLRTRFGALAGVANAVLRRLAEEAEVETPAARGAHGAALAGGVGRTAEKPHRGRTAGPTGDAPAGGHRGIEADADKIKRLATAYAHPTWLVRAWLARLGAEETEDLLRANNERPPLSLRVNRGRTTPAALRSRLQQAGHDVQISPASAELLCVRRAGAVTRLPGFSEGHFAVQDGAPALVAHLLTPPEGATVVDLCAAPGGKATHLAELVGPRGQVFAVDAHPGRLGLVVRNAARLGHASLVPVLADATRLGGLEAALLAVGGPGRGAADYVLVDPPCSGSGTLRRHPELRATQQGPSFELRQLQSALLVAAAELTAPGGTLVYAVCSLLAEEGEDPVRAFLAARPDFAPEPLPAALARYAADAVDPHAFPGLQTWPHRHGLDGFFAARLRRSP